MKITVVKIGRVAYPEIRTLAAVYQERLAPFAKVQAVDVKDDEAALRLLKQPANEHPVILLDERGKEWSSTELARSLQGLTDDPAVKTLTLIVGGPMGLSPALRAAARTTWSLSRATFTSDLAWLLVWEQLYRALSILKGTGYHHD